MRFLEFYRSLRGTNHHPFMRFWRGTRLEEQAPWRKDDHILLPLLLFLSSPFIAL